MPAGMQWIIDMGPMMRNKDIFADPHEFHPERFLDEKTKG